MRGTLGAVLRTGLVVVGFVVLLSGIVTLAYPPLLTEFVFTDQSGTTTNPEGGRIPADTSAPTLQASLLGIVWGMTVVAAGLAMPGRAAFGIREQPFTRRQRAFTLVGATFVVALPVAVWAVVTLTGQYVILTIPTALLALVGAVLVLIGASNGLK